jgi:ribosome-associated protein
VPLTVNEWLEIPDADLDERFVRASGPGGQNVNKVATAVQLRYDLRQSTLSLDVRDRLRALAGSRVTADDVLVIDARAHRTQLQNREDARQRLADLVRRALVRPKKRQKTHPGKAAKERRLESKKRRGETKRGRGRLSGDD